MGKREKEQGCYHRYFEDREVITMSMTDKLLGIALMIFFTTIGFGWGWVTRAIGEKDKKDGEE